MNLWWICFVVLGSRNVFVLGNIKGLVLVWRLDVCGGLMCVFVRLVVFLVRCSVLNNVVFEIVFDGFVVVC